MPCRAASGSTSASLAGLAICRPNYLHNSACGPTDPPPPQMPPTAMRGGNNGQTSTLHDACAKERIAGLRVAEIRDAVRSVAACLGALHARGVCHGDTCYCPAGYYSPSGGMVASGSACESCPGGQYTSSYGQTSCSTCPAVSAEQELV